MSERVITRPVRARPALWLSALAISAGFLVPVLLAVDWLALGDTLAAVHPGAVLLAVGVAACGGVFAALRLARLSAPAVLAECLRVSAWHALLLVVLPARLGEAAAVYLIHRHLHQPAGTALANLVVQRLFDALALGAVFVAVMLPGIAHLGAPSALALALAALAALGAALGAFEHLLAILARGLQTLQHRRIARRALYQALRARTWYRRRMDRATAAVTMLLTLAKWSCSLAAFVLLLSQLELGVDPTALLAVGVGYVFLGAVPLQSIGGLGIGEAGLTGMLVLNGVELGVAAGASVALRCVLLAAPFIFWALALGALELVRARRLPGADARSP